MAASDLLSDKAIRAALKIAVQTGKAHKLSDGNGLVLDVRPTGSGWWRLRYWFGGKEKMLSLGVYPDVPLAFARERRDEARRQVAAGVDPSEHRKAAKVAGAARDLIAKAVKAGEPVPGSFEAVARDWWAHWKGPKTERHADYVIRRLEADIFPAIGTQPVASLTAPQLLAMAKAIEARGALDLAKRSLQTCNQVLRYAVAHGLAERNPAADVRPSDALKSRRKTNYARVDAKELPELLRRIDAYQGTPVTRLAMKLMALTFVRTSELINARWEEFDLKAAEWRIPAERMKMRTPHIVPLAPQAVEVLRTLQTLSGTEGLLFPGDRNREKPMSNNTILAALGRMGYKHRMTGHGFRGIASTVLHELGFEHAHIELQLAHQERDEVSAAYNHATYLPQRRRLMAAWATHLDKLRKGAEVIPLKEAA